MEVLESIISEKVNVTIRPLFDKAKYLKVVCGEAGELLADFQICTFPPLTIKIKLLLNQFHHISVLVI